MVKCDYFENLEKLASFSLSAVKLACSGSTKESFSSIRMSCDRLVCETEDALFSDFLPPLERDSIASAAHSLSWIVDRAGDLNSACEAGSSLKKYNDEAEICIKLSEEIERHIKALRRIKHPNQMPNIQGFRKLLCDGRAAHGVMLKKLRSGALPKSYAECIILTGKLRTELSVTFDLLVEIMLNNI